MLKGLIQTDSFLIDRLKNPWITRVLFLLLFSITAVSRFFPLGNPDFTEVLTWYEENSASTTISDISAVPDTSGNIHYIIFRISIYLIAVFIVLFYSRLFIGELRKENITRSVKDYVIHIPMFIVLLLIMIGPVILTVILASLMSATFSSLALIVLMSSLVAAVFLSPLYIFSDKMNAYDALLNSLVYTKGFRLVVFLNLFLFVSIYITLSSLTGYFFPSERAGYLINSFFFTYVSLAIGRLFGIFYGGIRVIYDKSNSNENRNDHNISKTL